MQYATSCSIKSLLVKANHKKKLRQRRYENRNIFVNKLIYSGKSERAQVFASWKSAVIMQFLKGFAGGPTTQYYNPVTTAT